jgi:hypothetical protein
MESVERRLKGLIHMAEGKDEADGIQIADKAWLLSTVTDVTALVDAFVAAPVVPEAKLQTAEARLATLEAEHADRVWLTRDEARNMRYIATGSGFHTTAALLDERLGEKP